jgi:putative phosphoribosyl transferase
MRFADRREAGRRLADELRDFAGRDGLVVLGLPRGGVPVAAEVAAALDAPLGVFVVRKLGVPGHHELAFGAIASGGVCVLNSSVVTHARLTDEQIQRVIVAEQAELARRVSSYGGGVQLDGRTAILVDDGLATGATMHVAAAAVREAGAQAVVCAAPVASTEAVARLRAIADDVRMVATPAMFGAVGNFYDDFGETTDEQVREALASAQR